MITRLLGGVSWCLIVAAIAARAGAQPAAPAATDAASDALHRFIATCRAEHDLVALGAMHLVDGQIVAAAVDGERAAGSGVDATVDDRWHLGSITKSMTATMIARLVESEQMSWDDTVGEAFADFAELDPGWRQVTLHHLLTHTAGAPANYPPTVNLIRPEEGAARTKARRWAAELVLKTPPATAPGEKFAYSNAGYAIAGAMAEHATGDTWEELMRREVFQPLGLASAGFGAPAWGDADEPRQPRGHLSGFQPKAPVTGIEDNTPVIGPAGIVHMQLADLCAYGNEHARGAAGRGQLLGRASYQRLHRAALRRYAYGWLVSEGDDKLPGPYLLHDGSNTMWYALLGVFPERGEVVAVVCNEGNIPVAGAVAKQITRWLLDGGGESSAANE